VKENFRQKIKGEHIVAIDVRVSIDGSKSLKLQRGKTGIDMFGYQMGVQ
jgi:hypothetical protein